MALLCGALYCSGFRRPAAQSLIRPAPPCCTCVPLSTDNSLGSGALIQSTQPGASTAGLPSISDFKSDMLGAALGREPSFLNSSLFGALGSNLGTLPFNSSLAGGPSLDLLGGSGVHALMVGAVWMKGWVGRKCGCSWGIRAQASSEQGVERLDKGQGVGSNMCQQGTGFSVAMPEDRGSSPASSNHQIPGLTMRCNCCTARCSMSSVLTSYASCFTVAQGLNTLPKPVSDHAAATAAAAQQGQDSAAATANGHPGIGAGDRSMSLTGSLGLAGAGSLDKAMEAVGGAGQQGAGHGVLDADAVAGEEESSGKRQRVE